MSEVKGTLLAIVLAIAVFGLVFGVITVAMKQSADSIAQRMGEAADREPTEALGNSVVYTLP